MTISSSVKYQSSNKIARYNVNCAFLFVYSCLLVLAVAAVLSPILMNSSCQSNRRRRLPTVGVEIVKRLESFVQNKNDESMLIDFQFVSPNFLLELAREFFFCLSVSMQIDMHPIIAGSPKIFAQ